MLTLFAALLAASRVFVRRAYAAPWERSAR